MDRIRLSLRETLAHIMQDSPNQQLTWLLVALVSVILLNFASDALLQILGLSPLLNLLLLPAFVLLILIVQAARIKPRNRGDLIDFGETPRSCSGMILLLGLFFSRGDKQSPGLAGQDWRYDQLKQAVNQPSPDWITIIERFEHSNMQPALEAIRHHSRDGVLRHVWLVSTMDVERDGAIVQYGPHRLAPLFAKVLREGFGFNIDFTWDDAELKVHAYDVNRSYHAVTYIYSQLSSQFEIAPEDIIADITGGRVPMTGGMMMACASHGWSMQYTTTERDPAKPGPNDTPIPLEIDIDENLLFRSVLDTLQSQMS